MCATMTTAVITTAVATTSMTTTAVTATATFRSGIPQRRQHGRENNDGNPDIEFLTWHPQAPVRQLTHGTFEERWL